MLDVDPSQIRAREITHQLLEGWEILDRIPLEDCQEGVGFVFYPAGLYLFRVPQRLPGVDD